MSFIQMHIFKLIVLAISIFAQTSDELSTDLVTETFVSSSELPTFTESGIVTTDIPVTTTTTTELVESDTTTYTYTTTKNDVEITLVIDLSSATKDVAPLFVFLSSVFVFMV